MRTLFLITARGGSKGIPKKNIKPLAGKPLIYYAIDTARKLTTDENICLSTDDQEIIQTVENYGLRVPFVRPAELATDTAGSFDVLQHAIAHYEQKGVHYDSLVLLQPTSPFRKAIHVQEAMNLFEPSIDMVVSVKKTHSNPYFSLFEENESGFLEKSKKGNFERRQDAPEVWEFNGAVYVINVESLKKSRSFNDFSKIIKYEMADIDSLDLDTPLDWAFCEFLVQQNRIKLE